MMDNEKITSPVEDLKASDEQQAEYATAPQDTPDAQTEESYAPDGEIGTDKTAVKDGDIDYASVIAEDIASLAAEFSELSGLNDITELDDPMRYAALRDLGLTAREAYLATRATVTPRDNRAHLSGAYPKAQASLGIGGMSKSELESARELFSDLSDAEICELYKQATR